MTAEVIYKQLKEDQLEEQLEGSWRDLVFIVVKQECAFLVEVSSWTLGRIALLQ